MASAFSPEFNTFITMLGMMCAMVQAATGGWAAFKKKKIALVKANDIINRAHRAFGGFATTLYFLGLFAGLSGLVGALTVGEPPLELNDASFNIHTWFSFPVIVIVTWKTVISYFRKQSAFKRGKVLGFATFLAWAFTWISAGISYYLRTAPIGTQHPIPSILLPVDLAWLQILVPFVLGFGISAPIIRVAEALETKKQSKS